MIGMKTTPHANVIAARSKAAPQVGRTVSPQNVYQETFLNTHGGQPNYGGNSTVVLGNGASRLIAGQRPEACPSHCRYLSVKRPPMLVGRPTSATVP